MLQSNPRFSRILRFTHKETGLVVEVDNWLHGSRESWHKIQLRLLRIARAKLLGMQRGEYPVSQGDYVRTYHTSPYGTWTKDHRTGEVERGKFLGEIVDRERRKCE